MAKVKRLVERRVLLPIQEHLRAAKYGLVPPGAILLFGPPGTGKTALARAIAGRLGWEFVDVDLSTVALDSTRLRHLFERLFDLQEAVIFFDEFEHLGLKRESQTVPAEPLTAELLHGLPALRVCSRVLAICATNYVRMLDPALLRPGRFDLALPLGLPEVRDRAAILRSLLANRRCGAINVSPVARQSDGLTPADLEAVCQDAAHAAFEREVQGGAVSQIETADLLVALKNCRPSVTAEQAQGFQEDVLQFTRA